MGLMVGGIAVLAATVAIFIYCLPRGGTTSRFVGSAWEPMIGVAFCGGFATGSTMILSSAINALS